MIKSCVFFIYRLFSKYNWNNCNIQYQFQYIWQKKKQICLNIYKLRPNTKKVPTKKKKIHTQKIAFNASASWPTIAGSDLTRQSMFRLCPPSALNRSRRSSTAVHTRFSYALVSSRKTAALYAVSRGHFPSLSLGAFDVSVCVGVCLCVCQCCFPFAFSSCARFARDGDHGHSPVAFCQSATAAKLGE